MDRSIRKKILELAEEEYQKFSAALLPNIDNVLGVRLPLLRKLAKEIAKGDWQKFMAMAELEYFEEVMLKGMVLGYVKGDIEEILSYVADFVPLIDNWSVCDSFCIGLKFTQDNKERVWQFLQSYLNSTQEYEIRFGVVMLINFYIEDRYIKEVLIRLDNVKLKGYYAKMAVAWAVSICFVKLPKPTMEYLYGNTLDDFTYNKALQKITESYRVDKETKDLIRSMKRSKS
ncbi:DNA alkylation repair protein [Pelosinus sp. UFO1]|uniref:DNA alkylation repair protein n=1 Tax=Pelosinus sp. UFO1 TaxID=484770 RepID=UPI0004D15AFC|nr:DNA alkylation repair protein [Pelosinus sp. UFO1]AIF51026.1 DNA alkylation repair enzyme [Pelosinus sp. UFO1]